MKNIKYFQYKNTFAFEKFLCNNHYWVHNITGFKYGWKEQYRGNILKAYFIYFNDNEYKIFRVVYFKDLNECDKARLGLINNKLLMWYDDANVRKYKVKDIWGMDDKYVIEN